MQNDRLTSKREAEITKRKVEKKINNARAKIQKQTGKQQSSYNAYAATLMMLPPDLLPLPNF